MRTILSFVLISSICFLLALNGLARDERTSVESNSYWKAARVLWQRYSENPTRENRKLFYNFIRRAPSESQKQDMAWLVDDYRFKIEVQAGNTLIALAALRLSLKAREDYTREILSTVGKLSRINPELFLRIITEAYGFMGEGVKEIVVALPEEYEYLLSRAADFKEYADLLSYFYCHELKKRYEAISSTKGKNTYKAREICLQELKEKINEQKGCSYQEVSDQLLIDKIKEILNLSEHINSRIFDHLLKKNERKFISILKSDGRDFVLIDHCYAVLDPIIFYEAYSGNWKLLETILNYMTHIINLRESVSWELARINPGLLLRFLKYQEDKQGEERERINFLNSFEFLEQSPRIRIHELNLRIRALLGVKDKQYREIRDRYIRIMKDLRDKEIKNLKSSEDKKQRSMILVP